MDLLGTPAVAQARSLLSSVATEEVVITPRTITQDAFGGYTQTGGTPATVAARVGELSGREAADLARTNSSAQWAVSLPHGTQVESDSTLTVRGVVCEVVDVRHQWLQVRVLVSPHGGA